MAASVKLAGGLMSALHAEVAGLRAAGAHAKASELLLGALLGQGDVGRGPFNDERLLELGRDGCECFDAILSTRRKYVQTFLVKEFPGKGLSVIAARDIEKGERLIAEDPLLKLTPDGAGRFDGKYYGDRQLARALLASLSHAVAFAGSDPMNSVIQTNGIRVVPSTSGGPDPTRANSDQPGSDSVFSVVFLTISRFNHSCAPCAEFCWNDSLGQGTIYSLSDIPSGSEITFNYGASGSRDERRDLLSDKFGFDCDCTLCASQAPSGEG